MIFARSDFASVLWASHHNGPGLWLHRLVRCGCGYHAHVRKMKCRTVPAKPRKRMLSAS